MESKPADFRRCSGSHECLGTPDGTPTGTTVADTSRHTFTRGRAVEHEATTLLSARGYQVFLCSGTQSPVDLIAWSPQGHPALIKTERARVSVGSAAQVAKRYRGDLDALRTVIQPQLALVQLWILSPPDEPLRVTSEPMMSWWMRKARSEVILMEKIVIYLDPEAVFACFCI